MGKGLESLALVTLCKRGQKDTSDQAHDYICVFLWQFASKLSETKVLTVN